MDQTTSHADQATASGEFINAVRGSTTLEGGFTALREKIAGVLADTIGRQALKEVAESGLKPEPGSMPQITLTPESVQQLAGLHYALTTNADDWTDALLANTPLSDGADTQATTSRAAMA